MQGSWLTRIWHISSRTPSRIKALQELGRIDLSYYSSLEQEDIEAFAGAGMHHGTTNRKQFCSMDALLFRAASKQNPPSITNQ